MYPLIHCRYDQVKFTSEAATATLTDLKKTDLVQNYNYKNECPYLLNMFTIVSLLNSVTLLAWSPTDFTNPLDALVGVFATTEAHVRPLQTPGRQPTAGTICCLAPFCILIGLLPPFLWVVILKEYYHKRLKTLDSSSIRRAGSMWSARSPAHRSRDPGCVNIHTHRDKN